MAFTIVGMRKATEKGHPRETIVYVSHEYIPHKERDAMGGVLPNQEWQHPDPQTLHYCRLGTLMADLRVENLVESILGFGADHMGGHIRILFQEHAPWIEERLDSWSERRAREQQEYEREREMQAAAEAAERAPVYDYCPRCNNQMEQCKNPMHRGHNRCMRCNGGESNVAKRHCNNCHDLKYREKREAALGHSITYAGEES
jgi:hypothetical protein